MDEFIKTILIKDIRRKHMRHAYHRAVMTMCIDFQEAIDLLEAGIRRNEITEDFKDVVLHDYTNGEWPRN